MKIRSELRHIQVSTPMINITLRCYKQRLCFFHPVGDLMVNTISLCMHNDSISSLLVNVLLCLLYTQMTATT